jgi:hypothetical protein
MVEDDTYEYGYYGSQAAIVFTINSIFNAYNPSLNFAAMIFFCYRLTAESAVLLTVHGKEMEGKGILVLTIIRKCFYGMFLGHLLACLRSFVHSYYYTAVCHI